MGRLGAGAGEAVEGSGVGLSDGGSSGVDGGGIWMRSSEGQGSYSMLHVICGPMLMLVRGCCEE